MDNVFTKSEALVRTWAIITSIALILSAFPASFLYATSIGITVDNSNLVTNVGEKVNFIVSTVTDEDTASTTPGTFVSVSDVGGGQFYNGKDDGTCNVNTPDVDNQFSIGKKKGICYSNSTPGVWTIIIQLLDSKDGNPIGKSVNVSVDVKEAISEPAKVNICHATDSVSNPFVKNEVDISGLNGHDEHQDDIIPVTDSNPGQNLSTMYGGKTGAEVLVTDCVVPQIIDNPPVSAVLAEICKKDEQGNPISGWEMTLTNGDVSVMGETREDGCFYVYDIDVEDGTWQAREENRYGYEQVSVTASEPYGSVVLEPQTEDERKMCQFRVDKSPLGGSIYFYSSITIEPVFRCDFVNKEIPDPTPEPCIDGQKDWADKVHSASQAKLKNGNPITDPNRTDSSKVLGVSDWTSGASTGFYSLGFGGSVAVEFDNYVLDVDGVDISIHEATNGKYPLERAEIFVSQNGSDWTSVGYADNTAGDKVTYLDISSSGLAWIKFVKVVDVSDPTLHTATADAFDLDAVDATKSVCDIPTPPKVCKVTIVSDETNTVVEKGGAFAKLLTWIHPNWTAVVNAPSKWIWGDDPVANPVSETNQTFEKKFGWNGPITSAQLTVAADNSYTGSINGDLAAMDAGEYNFRAGDEDVYDVSSHIDQGNNTLSLSVKNFAKKGGTAKSNPAGLKYELVITGTDESCDIPYVPEPEYADFCGDGVVNQEWEQCDSGHLLDSETDKRLLVGCSEQCQFIGEPICTDLTLAKVDMSVQNKGVGDMTTDVYLGQGALPIPNGAWFLVHWNKTYVNDADISGYEDVPGLAVERSGGSVRSVMHGSTSAKDKEHSHGTIEFWSWDGSVEATFVTSDNSGNNKLEGNYSDGSGIGKMNAGDDEVSILNGVAKFWLTTTTADDGFITEYSKPVVCEEDPVCEVDVNLIENGGFELPTVSSWKVFYTGAPGLAWLTGENGIEIQRGVAGSPHSGRQHAELDPHKPTMIWQEIATIPGETYKFSTYYSPRPGRNAEDNRFEFLLNGAALGSSTARSGVGNSNTVWTLEEREFVATGSTTSVGFREVGTATSYGAYIDDVSLSCVKREPPVDVCSNLPGDQSEVPAGYELVDGDICRLIEQPPVDVCSNLPGDQSEVPAGYELVDEDYCQMIVVLGCTDSEATNYNPLATTLNPDAEKCDYPESSTPRKKSSGSYIGTFLRAQPAPLVLGASTSSLCPLIVDHMQMGWNNRPSEVIKLQLFLNIFKDMYGGVENPVTGFFGPTTDANVKAFQEKYRSEILDPWFIQGIVPHSRPTGFVYKTTKWKINSIVCPDSVTPVNFEGENLLTNVDIIRN